MAQNPSQLPSDELRTRMIDLKRKAYSHVVLYYIIRRVVEKLNVAEDLDSEQVDTIVFNTMMDKLSKTEGGS